MAAGKSTVGRRLAQSLGWTFVDTDTLVEKRERRTIERIFSEAGEAYFRDVEWSVLRESGVAQRCVVATGGGIFVGYAQRRWIRRTGRSVWLDLPWPEARRRLGDATVHRRERPLWSGHDPIAMRVLYERRRAAYALAQYRIDAAAGSTEQLVRSIRVALEL